MPPLHCKHQVPGFAPDEQVLWAVKYGSLSPATSLSIANRLIETHAADNGLRVCGGAQLTSTLGCSVALAKALSALGSSGLGLQAWAPPGPELATLSGGQRWSECVLPYPSRFSRGRTFEVTL